MIGSVRLGHPALGSGPTTAPTVRPDGPYLEFRLAGSDNWVDVTQDAIGTVTVTGVAGLQFQRGLSDGKPGTYLASVGTLTGALNNSALNSAKLAGFYSPIRSDARIGFRQNILARLIYILNNTLYVLFTGRITTINPLPGLKKERTCAFTVSDFFYDMQKEALTGLATQINITGDVLLRTVIAAMQTQPVAMDFDVGVRTFPYGMVGGTGGTVNPIQEAQRVCASEQGLLYVKGDGTLRWENQAARLDPTSAFTLDDSNLGENAAAAVAVTVISDEDDVINGVQVTTHNRTVQGSIGSEIILSSLDGATPQLIPSGQTITVNAPYRDPNNLSTATSGKIAAIDLLPFTATTDYLANASADGLGTDYTANLVVSVAEGSTGFTATITNTGPDAYLTKRDRRGVGLFDYGPIVSQAADPVSQQAYSANVIALDLAYEPDPAQGQAVANVTIAAWANPFGYAKTATFAVTTPAKLAAACTLDIGDCVTVREQITGIASQFFINGVAWDLQEAGRWIAVTWILAPLTQRSHSIVPVNVDYCLVGGGSTESWGGGGGGGQVIQGTDALSGGSYQVNIGVGGSISPGDDGNGHSDGGPSSFHGHVAAGGLYSRANDGTGGTSGSGKVGGAQVPFTTSGTGGCGGGAGDAANGGAGSGADGGNGGDGTASLISGKKYGAGGGGGAGAATYSGNNLTPGNYGVGGADNTAAHGGKCVLVSGNLTGVDYGYGNAAGIPAAPNIGGGAGGGARIDGGRSAGGSGVAEFRYTVASGAVFTGGVKTTDGTYWYHTFTVNDTFIRTT